MIPREGVERMTGLRPVRPALDRLVIPREGVESILWQPDQIENNPAVIPREGVERAPSVAPMPLKNVVIPSDPERGS